ncbi:rhomboid family intramembrane serine protease [Pseudochryseolinea flava]|uniref:Rhomboid family intramembrane serine protease n=2 Tax=Pseudochryseolinea flava TaxID=2059302 RepID=A0A364Y017_9BACT|nr:rhomboid family intramembrane serine protease [Pseudochryseolinea flava]
MPITYIIIGLTVVVSMSAFNNAELMRKLIMNPYTINARQEYYRFVTSGFIHGDHMHLIVNMISLYFFGPTVEAIFALLFGKLATVYFIALYILAIVVSDFTTFFKNKNNPGYNSLGASGGVCAIIFAFILFNPLGELSLYFFIPMKGFIFGFLYVIYSYYSSKKSYDNINHDAHLWGALFGIVFCAILYPPSIPHFIEQILSWTPFQ